MSGNPFCAGGGGDRPSRQTEADGAIGVTLEQRRPRPLGRSGSAVPAILLGHAHQRCIDRAVFRVAVLVPPAGVDLLGGQATPADTAEENAGPPAPVVDQTVAAARTGTGRFR